MRIVPASIADSDTLAALHQACFARGWSAQDFEAFFEREGTVALMAHNAMHAVGFIVCTVVADESELVAMAVLEPYRKQGIAHGLLTAAWQRCTDVGAQKIHLEVGVSNLAAQTLYARHGFVVTGKRVGYYHAPDGTLEDALTMTKVCKTVTPSS